MPFIDLMSCMTAFLLVTAVWVNMSSLDVAAQGRSRDISGEEEKPHLAVLVEQDQVSLTLYPAGDTQKLAANDWKGLEGALRVYATASEMPPVRVAANSTASHPIEYKQLIAAMDTAVKVGYHEVGIVDPMQLMR